MLTMLNEFVVPMGFSLKSWQAYRKKHKSSNKDYHKKHPKKKWKVVHGKKKGEVGKAIKGLSGISYGKATKAHTAIKLSEEKLMNKKELMQEQLIRLLVREMIEEALSIRNFKVSGADSLSPSKKKKGKDKENTAGMANSIYLGYDKHSSNPKVHKRNFIKAIEAYTTGNNTELGRLLRGNMPSDPVFVRYRGAYNRNPNETYWLKFYLQLAKKASGFESLPNGLDEPVDYTSPNTAGDFQDGTIIPTGLAKVTVPQQIAVHELLNALRINIPDLIQKLEGNM